MGRPRHWVALVTNLAAEMFHRSHEPDFYARKCRRCKQAECECDDGEPRPTRSILLNPGSREDPPDYKDVPYLDTSDDHESTTGESQ